MNLFVMNSSTSGADWSIIGASLYLSRIAFRLKYRINFSTDRLPDRSLSESSLTIDHRNSPANRVVTAGVMSRKSVLGILFLLGAVTVLTSDFWLPKEIISASKARWRRAANQKGRKA